mgnify:CR=1 FL=1
MIRLFTSLVFTVFICCALSAQVVSIAQARSLKSQSLACHHAQKNRLYAYSFYKVILAIKILRLLYDSRNAYKLLRRTLPIR